MRLPLPPIALGTVSFVDDPETTAGHVVLLPLGAEQILTEDRSFVRQRLTRAIDLAGSLGARTVGLGALTAPISRGGKLVAGRSDLGVTNGNAFTAVMTVQGIERLLPRCEESDPHVAIVGATGSVGSCVVRLLAERQTVSRLTLIARNQTRLERLARAIARPGLSVATQTSVNGAYGSDLVVLMTSATEAILGSEHLKEGAIVLDDTQPRNTHVSLISERPDVLVVDGGVVAIPGATVRADIGLPAGTTYACMAETMLLSLSGHTGDFGLGAPTIEQARLMMELAREYQHLGFHLAPPHSFGRRMEMEWDPHDTGAVKPVLSASTPADEVKPFSLAA